MARLNIAEKRLPQDGRMKLKVAGREIDVRVSVIPMIHGEGIVMRVLDKGAMAFELRQQTPGGLDHQLMRVARTIAMDLVIQRKDDGDHRRARQIGFCSNDLDMGAPLATPAFG